MGIGYEQGLCDICISIRNLYYSHEDSLLNTLS